jgi:type 1 glutamine amidotransferase
MTPHALNFSRRDLLGLMLGAGAALGPLPAAAHAPAVAARERAKRLLLIAGTQSHPHLMHEYNSGVLLLKQCLDPVPDLETRIALSGWPKDASLFDGVDAVVLYMDGGTNHYALKDDHLAKLSALMDRGVGLGCCHYAVELPAGEPAKQFQSWIGGTYETHYSCNPVWTPSFDTLPSHPITRGVKPFSIEDEWYFNMRFRDDMSGITPILSAAPSDKVRHGPYVSPRGPYDHIIKASGRKETLMWTMERPGGGRGFGFTGGHFHKNWADDNFRKIVLNALLWVAKREVPESGVRSSVSDADLRRGLYATESPGK